MSVYVGIDVHRKRSQVAVVGEDGRVQLNRNVVNGSPPMLGLLGGLPPGTAVAFEAAFGWGWLAGLLEDYGFESHLVHPLRCKAIASARLKNDKVDAAILAQLLRAGLLPEAWIAPPQVRALRALLRHRIQLVRLRTLLGNRVHAVAADHGYDRSAGYWSGPGRTWLACLDLPPASRQVIDDDLALIDALTGRVAALDDVWPQAIVQTCIVHLIRNTFRLASRRDWDALKRDLKPIYTAVNAAAAQAALEELAERWGQRYPAIIRLWRNAWEEFVPFLDYDTEIRQVLCSTNAIESLNARYRRAVKARGHFPTEQAALKCLYLVTRSLDPTGRGKTRWAMR